MNQPGQKDSAVSDQSQRALVSLPENFLELTREEQTAFLKHALRHIRRSPSPESEDSS